MAKNFYTPNDKRPPRLRAADITNTDPANQDAAYPQEERIDGAGTTEPVEHATQPTYEDNANVVADEDLDRSNVEEPADEGTTARRTRTPWLAPLLAIALLAAAGYAYVNDVGGVATGIGQLKSRMFGTTETAKYAQSPPNQPQGRGSDAPRTQEAAMQQTLPATQTRSTLPPPPDAEPMRTRTAPTTMGQDDGANIQAVVQQQQIERMRQLLAVTATLSRDTASQANKQEARLADLEQRLVELSTKVAAMSTGIAAHGAPTITTAEAPSAEKVVEGYSLTGASQTAARVSASGKEEDVRIGGTHPVLGNVIGLRKYSNDANWRCNYELVTERGVVRPASNICKRS